MNRIYGQRVVRIRTLKSMYDMDTIEVTMDDGNNYRMSCDTIKQMVNDYTFDVEKKRKHSYLMYPENLNIGG